MFDRNAVIILNKPTGMSSFLAVKKVSRALGVKKAGHMGTLDPYGTGVLLVGVNRATKLFDEFLKKDKTYVTIFHFGYETDTIDSEGKIINSNNVIITDAIQLAGADARFNIRFDHLQHFGSQSASDAHFFDIFWGLD